MKKTLAKECATEKQGFTLIEIMLVIAIMGILAIVTLPKYQAITDHYKLESSAQIVVGQLRYAQQLAMDQRKDSYLAMDTNTVQVLSNDLSGNLKVFGGIQALESGVTFDSSSAVGNGLMINPGQAKGLPYVQYDPRGFVQNLPAGGAVKIVLTTVRSGRSVAINVEVYTGNITLEW